jgi:hypothetical protein
VKNSFSIMLSVGVGFLALQGCAGAEYTGDAEDVGVQESAVTLPASCISRQGTNASKAALAVAMGIELGRWDTLKDLEVVNGRTRLKAGVTCLNNSNCARTKAVLGQQDYTPDQNRFNNTSYQSDLSSSTDRQRNWIDRLTQNYPDRLPPAHKLKLVGTVTMTGACGPHYLFQVDNADGTAMTTAKAAYMSNTLCYFGQDANGMSCGNNTFVGFTQVQAGCPAGRVCVAIDPDDGDAGSGTINTAGSAPTYTLNRLWDPANTKLNSQCTKTSGPVGTMQSKCATATNTCGYLYCL